MNQGRRFAVALSLEAIVIAALFLTVTHAHAQEASYTTEDTVLAIHQYADEFGVPETWLMRVVRCESNLNPYARGRLGERGAVQLLPGGSAWWRFFDWGYDQPDDPYQAVRFLAQEYGFGRASQWSCAR